MVTFIDGNGKGKFAINIDNDNNIKSWSKHVGVNPDCETVKYSFSMLEKRLKQL
jgi:hypothetical protein